MMKVKRSKHVVHHSDGYTPVVRCTLNLRHKVSVFRRGERGVREYMYIMER